MERAAPLLRALRRRVRAARPTARTALRGTLLWAACNGLNAMAILWLRGWRGFQLGEIGLLFAAGALLAFAPSLWIGSFLGGLKRRAKIFAAVFLSVGTATLSATGLLFALEYRSYYARWHDAALSKLWLIEFLSTVAGALYQFAALGLSLFFPISFAALFLVAFQAARRLR